jgi:DNA-binding transcriptional ArsR family regulator
MTPSDTEANQDPPPLSREAAERLADTMFALAAPSRLLILTALRDGPRTVSEIIAAVGMEQSAVSHQLRVLREHAVVSVERRGRERLYGLRDEHVGALLDHALRHVLELVGASGGIIKRGRLDRAG